MVLHSSRFSQVPQFFLRLRVAIFCEAVPEAKESESLSLAKQNVSLAVLQTLEITIWHPLMDE